MLAKTHRLHTDRDIAHVLKRGRSVWGVTMGVRGVANGLAITRATVVVSTKVSKRAVDRNVLKRRLREIVRAVFPKLQTGWDMMVLTKSSTKTLTFAQLQKELEGILRKAGVL